MERMRVIIKICIVALLFLVPFSKISAQTSETIQFKTSIIDQAERPLADGTYNFRFAFYNQTTGGTTLWSEDWYGVPVRMAAISVSLGTIVPFPTNLFKNESLYLQICLDANGAEGDGFGECAGAFEENFQPRKVMGSVPWAFNAGSLGPVTISNGETAYEVDTYGSQGNLLELNFNDNNRFRVTSTGDMNLGNGLNNFYFSPENNILRLTENSDIYFGNSISIRGSGSSSTSGASLIGVSTNGLQNITGSNLQTIINNLDPLLRWRSNGNSIFYNGGNVGIGTNNPAFALDIVGTGNFNNGIIVANNTNNTAGAIRFNAGTFEGYDGGSWIPFAGSALSQWQDNGANIFFNTGNVGIGTNTPNRPLEINGAIRLDAIAAPGAPASGDIYSSGTNLLYYNGSGWVTLTNQPVTDNGAGLAYITNVTNGFAVGGSTTAAPYYLDPTAGTGFATFLRPLSLGDSAGFGATTNLLRLNAAGANTVTTGNYSNLRANLAYTPTGAGGTEVIHGTENNITINAGDGTDIFAVRGDRNVITNNSTGDTDRIIGTSNQINNNGITTGNINALFGSTINTASYNLLYGIATEAINSSALYTGSGAIRGGNFVAQNQGTGVSQTLEGTSVLSTNDGTVDGQMYAIGAALTNNNISNFTYGIRATTRNNGTTQEFGGTLFDTYNDGDTGVQPADGIRNFIYNGETTPATTTNLSGISNLTRNFAGGTVSGDLRGISNTIANAGTVLGNTYGIVSTDGTTTVMINSNNTYAIDTTGGPVRFSNEAVVGDSVATETGSIRFSGGDFEGYDGGSWVSFTAGGGGGSQWIDNGADIFFNAGVVGIGGVASGTYSLEIAGNLYVATDTTLNSNVGIGGAPGTDILTVSGNSTFNNDVFIQGNTGLATLPNFAYILDVGGDINIQGTTNLVGLNVTGVSLFTADVTIQNAALCVDGGTGCPALSPGGIYGDLAYAEFDVAENILADSNVEAGDLVSTKEGEREVVRKSNTTNERNLLGIISTNPGSLGGYNLQPRDGFIVLPLVLSGRVPVKVTIENGEIQAGDPITSSSIPGVGMRATESKGKIVGYAMESYDGQGISKIIVMYQPGYLP